MSCSCNRWPKLLIKLLLLGLFLLYVQLLAAQPATRLLGDYARRLSEFSFLNPQEKVWLHFDNTGYYIGETMWFAAYVVEAAGHRPVPVSRVLYVELLTPEGLVVDSRKLEIRDGRCHGEFRLKHEYRSGFYEVRAYTRSMLNFGDDVLFSRVFPVYSDPKEAGNYAEKKMDSPDVLWEQRIAAVKGKALNLSFYPEGGYAVCGLPSRIAFRATGREGEWVDVRGQVYDGEGREVASFATEHQGMGSFEFTPEGGDYRVVAESGTHKRTFILNGIVSSGYVLRVDGEEDAFRVAVRKSSGLPYDTLALSVMCRGKVYALEAFGIGAGPYVYCVPRSALPVGCLQFTLFDKRGHVLAERLAFNEAGVDYLMVEAGTDKSVYRPLEKVEMELSVRDSSGRSAAAVFSLAVYDAGSAPQAAYGDNILTGLLLSSDVRGYIENPDQYFTDADSVTRHHLDLLMLVQGWSRYDWAQMSGSVPFEVRYYAEERLDLSGRVLDYSKDEAQKGVDVLYLMSKDSMSFHGSCKTDGNGRFHFTFPAGADIRGKWQLGLYVTDKGKRRHCRILLDRSGPRGRAYGYYDVLVRDSTVEFEEVTDSVRRSVTEMQYIDEVVVRGSGEIRPDIVFDVERDINWCKDRGELYPLTVLDYMENRVSVMDGIRYAGQLVYLCYSYNRPSTPDRFKASRITPWRIDIEDVYQIKIYYRNQFAWRYASCGECLEHAPLQPAVFGMVKLYDDGLHDKYEKGIRQTFYNGWSGVKKYRYTDNSKKLPGEADFRRTLYWNPEVRTDESGKLKISFYNNSSCRKMQVSAAGIAKNRIIIGNGRKNRY